MTNVETRYAVSDGVHIAYQEHGSGPLDLVVVPPALSHLEIRWEDPSFKEMFDRLGGFARVISLDKRGSGLSDRRASLPTAEEQVTDLLAVMDAVGAERASFFGGVDGGAACLLLAASHPERVDKVVVYATPARLTQAPDYPYGWSEGQLDAIRSALGEGWGKPALLSLVAPSMAGNEDFTNWFTKMQRSSASPAEAGEWLSALMDLDIRDVLSSVSAPVLVLNRENDPIVSADSGRDLAERLSNGRFISLPGGDYIFWIGDTDPLLNAMHEFLLGKPADPEPDRILATMMFTDIVGSTELAAKLGDAGWRRLLEAHHAAVRREIDAFRGREVDTAGDGFFALFDGPARAVRCATSIAQRIKDLGLEIRAGIHTGEVETSGDAVRGLGVHIGARIASLAQPGSVFVSSTVRDLTAGSGLKFKDRGTHRLKGVPDEWRVFAVEEPLVVDRAVRG